jgi:hypothetical protein
MTDKVQAGWMIRKSRFHRDVWSVAMRIFSTIENHEREKHGPPLVQYAGTSSAP